MVKNFIWKLLWKTLPTATINHGTICLSWRTAMRRDKVKRIFSGNDEGIFAKMVIRRAAASEFDCLPSFLFKVYPAHAQVIWSGSAKVYPGFASCFGKAKFLKPLRNKWHLGGCLSSRLWSIYPCDRTWSFDRWVVFTRKNYKNHECELLPNRLCVTCVV